MKTIAGKILDNQSTAANFFSEAFEVYYVKMFSIQFSFVGNAKGTITIQASNDSNPNTTIWNDITDASFTITGNNNYLIQLNDCAYRQCRIKYASQLGTGTVNANIIGKGE